MYDVLSKIILGLAGLVIAAIVAWLIGRFGTFGVLRSLEDWRRRDGQEEDETPGS